MLRKKLRALLRLRRRLKYRAIYRSQHPTIAAWRAWSRSKVIKSAARNG